MLIKLLYLLQSNNYCYVTIGTSAFNTVVSWHKLGEVENEYIAEKLVFSAIFVPKIFTIGINLTKFWQKNKFAQFF